MVNQREVPTHTGSFKAALRAALREDPDVILVGELRDLETDRDRNRDGGNRPPGVRHAAHDDRRLDRRPRLDEFPPDEQAQIRVMLSESLRGVIAQTLCRKIGGGRVAALEVLLRQLTPSAT